MSFGVVLLTLGLAMAYPLKQPMGIEPNSTQSLEEAIRKAIYHYEKMKQANVPPVRDMSPQQWFYYRTFYDTLRMTAMKGRKGSRLTHKEMCCIHTWPSERFTTQKPA